ncbi:hypothetical protein ACIBVK_29605 [Micromonospora echinofusca]|uniref:hypothetical protein n=1 Tax=Micromonospora echinofusca TaxID=47858 RepID=UPI00378D331F
MLLGVLLLVAACVRPAVQPPVSMPTPSLASTSSSAPPVAAGPVLTRLADRLSDAPADTTTGAYQYVERRTWYRDIIGPAGPTGWPERVRIDQLWRTDDARSGRQVSVLVAANGCTPHDADSSWTRHASDQFDGTPPRTPADLRTHLLIGAGPEETKPQHIVAGIAALYERQALTRPVRAAALRLLVQQPGMLVQTGVTDRIHRPGLDVILPYTDGSGVPRRDILTIDASTGVLLAAYSTITGPIPTLDPRMGPDGKAVMLAEAASYRLYIDSRRTPSTRVPAAGCQHPAARK